MFPNLSVPELSSISYTEQFENRTMTKTAENSVSTKEKSQKHNSCYWYEQAEKSRNVLENSTADSNLAS